MIEQLAQQTTITSSARLAQSLHQQYGDYQRNQGHQVWPTPDILPWEAWLQRCWQQAEEGGIAPAGRLLGDAEVQLLWQRLVEQDQPGLLDIQQTSRRAAQAWQRVQLWLVADSDIDPNTTREVAAFRRWMGQYRALLAEHNWLDMGGWANHLAAQSSTSSEALNQTLAGLVAGWRQHQSRGAESNESPQLQSCLAGFDRLTPVQAAIKRNLEQLGVEMRYPQWDADNEAIETRIATDSQQELLDAADWARQRLQQQPDQKLAVVVPDLLQRRGEVEREFQRVFEPQQLLGASSESPSAYAIAMGEPLSEYRLVADGLRVLDLLSWKLPLELATGVLLSPFVLEREHRDRRAELDLNLRQLGKTSVALREIGFLVGEGEHHGVRKINLPSVADAVAGSLSLLESLPRRALPSLWSGFFVEQLNIWRWPGDAVPDSVVYQTWSAWQELLSQFAGLDASAGELSLQQARSLLRRLANQRRFQPLNSDAGVQVLSNLEPWPDQFDAIRVVGLDDRQFPALGNSNPFLPLALQRRLEMPDSSPAQALRQARQQLLAWRIGSGQLITSFAQLDDNGERLGSPLIDWSHAQRLVAGQDRVVTPAMRLFAAAEQTDVIEHYDDDRGEPVLVDSGGHARGGVGLFQEQAECPFKAYLRRRLGADLPQEPLPGLDMMQQGELLHRLLEHFWRAVGDSRSLRQLDEEQLNQQIHQAAEAAIAATAPGMAGLESSSARELEQFRLVKLLTHWLPAELKRDDFTVTGFEQKIELQVGELLVRGRADRIDQLADGRRLVIDYKSGAVKRKHWFGERLLAPQLPLYQLPMDDAAGVAFAQLKPGDQKYVDVGEGGFNTRNNAKDPSWDELREQWYFALTELAQEYLEGAAAVAPAEPEVCNYCELSLACRIKERDNGWASEETA